MQALLPTCSRPEFGDICAGLVRLLSRTCYKREQRRGRTPDGFVASFTAAAWVEMEMGLDGAELALLLRAATRLGVPMNCSTFGSEVRACVWEGGEKCRETTTQRMAWRAGCCMRGARYRVPRMCGEGVRGQ